MRSKARFLATMAVAALMLAGATGCIGGGESQSGSPAGSEYEYAGDDLSAEEYEYLSEQENANHDAVMDVIDNIGGCDPNTDPTCE